MGAEGPAGPQGLAGPEGPPGPSGFAAFIEEAAGNYAVSIEHGGSWIESITKNATGTLIVNIQSGVFSVTPVCTVSAEHINGVAHVMAQIHPSVGFSETAIGVIIARHDNLEIDTGLFIICTGG